MLTLGYLIRISVPSSCICVFQAMKLKTPVPPPHHPCFFNERNMSNFSHHNITQNLPCNQHLLVLLSLALQRAAAYERCHNAYSIYSSTMLRAKGNLERIGQALSNITRVNNDLVNSTCGLPSLSSLSAPLSEGNTRQLRRCYNSNSLQAFDNSRREQQNTESMVSKSIYDVVFNVKVYNYCMLELLKLIF